MLSGCKIVVKSHNPTDKKRETNSSMYKLCRTTFQQQIISMLLINKLHYITCLQLLLAKSFVSSQCAQSEDFFLLILDLVSVSVSTLVRP